jgi:large subunit ribosomal protein L24
MVAFATSYRRDLTWILATFVVRPGLQGAMSRLPLVAIRSAADMLGEALQPRIPAHISVNIDALMLAGATLQDVHGDFSADDRGWSINKLDLRAPGLTRIHAAGRLTGTPGGHSFSGPATVESADPKTLAAWMEGGTPWPGGPVGPLRASGDVTLGSDRIEVDRLSAELDRKRITGRLDYSRAWQGKGPRLEAALSAAELDLDGAAAFLRNALPEMRLELPAECVLALDIGHATVAGVEAERAKAKLRFDADGLAIDELTIGDFAGAAVAVSGRVQAPWSAPTGTLKLTLSGQRLGGLAGPLGRIAPRVAETLGDIAPRLGPARLTLALTVGHPSGDDTGSLATVQLDGTVGTLRVAATGNARGRLADWSAARMHGDAKIDADDGRALARLLALDRAVTVAPGAGSLRVTADSTGSGAFAFKAKLTVPGVAVDAAGVARPGDDGRPTGSATVAAAVTDATALRAVTGRPDQPAPFSLKAKAGLAGNRFTFDDLVGQIADSRLSGQIALTVAPAGPRIEGRLTVDRLHAGALLAALAGMPQSRAGQQSGWPSQPFGPRFLTDLSGQVALTAQRADVGSKLEIRQAQAVLRLKESEASLADIHGTLAGGRLTGDVSLQRGVEGIDANLRLGLNGADLGTLMAAGPHPPVAGHVSVQVEAKGSGRSPLVLIETLGGSGSISAERLDLAGLDPAAFEAAARMADQSAAIDTGKLKALVESRLGRNRLHLAHLDGAFTLSSGQVRLGGVVAHADKTDLGLAATFDLAKSDLDARITLLGSHMGEAGGRPEISVMLKGPLAAPARTVDVSTLAGWLTLRAVDQQAKRLEAAEAERRKANEAAQRMEEAARQAAAQRRAAEAEEQKRGAAEAAAQVPANPVPAAQVPAAQVPANHTPTPAPVPLPAPQPRATHAPALPPPIEIRPLPGQHPSSSTHTVPHIIAPAQESVLRPSAVIQRDPRLPQ